MSSSGLIRLGGLAAVLSGVLLVISELLYIVVGLGPTLSAETATSGSYLFQQLLFLLAGVLLSGGLVGLYASQSENMGTLGLAGFLVAFVGTTLAVGAFWDSTFTPPDLARVAPALVEAGPPPFVGFGITVSFVLFTLGWLLFGLAALRARAYPRVVAGLLMVGAVLAFFPLPFSTIVFGVAVAWMGSILFSGRAEAARQPARVS